MRAVLKILHRSLVIEFYKHNAAFFGLIILVFFGFIRGNEHLIIGAFLVSNPGALFFLYALWLVYSIKVILFLKPEIHKSQNSFLESFLLLSNKVKFTSLYSVSLFILAPVLFYGSFLMFLAISKSHFLTVFSITGFILLLSLGLSAYIHYQLHRLPHEKQVFQLRFFKKITLAPKLFYISFLLRKEVVLFILTKIYTCLLIIGTSALYTTDDFDLRLLATGVLLATVGNVTIMHKYVWFQYQPLAFSLNLPRTYSNIIMSQIMSIIIVSIPEIVVLFRHYPISMNVLNIIGLLLLVIGLNHFMYAWMIRQQVELSNFIVVVFWIVVFTTFFILFSVHPLLIGIFLLAISMIIIYFRHYQYEHTD